MPRKLPSADELRKVLHYDSFTGKLFWKARTLDMFIHRSPNPERVCHVWNEKYASKETFIASDRGYKLGSVFGVRCRAHQVIWAMMTGSWNNKDIDHIDMNKGNNAWSNLRAASRSENQSNVAARKNNTSGFKGVFYHSQANKWTAEVKVNGKKHYLGIFANKQDAVDAATLGRLRLHGDFARHT